MNKVITLFASSLVLAGLGLENASAIELPACVNKKTGAWRIVAAVKKCSAKTENLVLLNSTGQAGAAGLAGAAGAQGPQGIKGDKGDKGDQGLPGAKGDTGPAGPGAAGSGGLKVYDANNQFLGYSIGQQLIYIPGLEAKAQIGVRTGASPPDEADLVNVSDVVGNTNYTAMDSADELFTSTNCTGTAYAYAASGIGFFGDFGGTKGAFDGHVIKKITTSNGDGGTTEVPGRYLLQKYEPAVQLMLVSAHYPASAGGNKGGVVIPAKPERCEPLPATQTDYDQNGNEIQVPRKPAWVRPIINPVEVTLPFTTPILLPLRYDVK